MSSHREDYLAVGVDIFNKIKEMDEDEIEELEDLFYKKYKFEMIRDELYCVVGKKLRYSDDYQDTCKPFEIDSKELEKICAEVKPILDKVLNEDTVPKLLSFTHYS